jgi:hypothetical protein
MAGADEKERFGNSPFPRQSIWMPNAFIAAGVVIKGPLLGGDVLSWISNTPECFRYRVDLIKWIQDRLDAPETATHDAVIGAIMTLTMWEVISSFSHQEALSHLKQTLTIILKFSSTGILLTRSSIRMVKVRRLTYKIIWTV